MGGAIPQYLLTFRLFPGEACTTVRILYWHRLLAQMESVLVAQMRGWMHALRFLVSELMKNLV